MATPAEQVEQIRHASRRLVRELGFMHDELAESGLSASQVHALIELDGGEPLPASVLAERLMLDKSSISRLVTRLAELGLIASGTSEADGRQRPLSLTEAGHGRLARIHAFARRRVEGALAGLAEPQRQEIERGLAGYAAALADTREAAPAAATELVDGYRPGCLGRIVALHMRYYARTTGLGLVFESRVAAGLAEFLPRLERPGNRLWTLWQGGHLAGSLAIDAEDPDGAHLRWFIVDDALRGQGWGRRLLAEALAHCDRIGCAQTWLDTFAGLDAARHLYEAAGFELTESQPGSQWGLALTEQRFVRPRPATAGR